MRKVVSILGLVMGVITIILAFTAFDMNTGYYEVSETYGGDAYTGIQNAAATTANNVQDLAEIMAFGFGSVLLVSGVAMILGSLKGLANPKPPVAPAAPVMGYVPPAPPYGAPQPTYPEPPVAPTAPVAPQAGYPEAPTAPAQSVAPAQPIYSGVPTAPAPDMAPTQNDL